MTPSNFANALDRMPQYLLIWEFHVRRGRENQFKIAYGPNGDWVQLFSKAQGFIRTELNHDLNHPRRYLTFDYWSSLQAYENFRQQHREQYTAIDQRCEGLTETEVPLGSFEIVAANSEGQGIRS
jgi:heme-degrading monooxygenase HmoA